MRCDEPDRRQRDRTLFERREDRGETPRRAGRLDAVIRGTLGQV
jgi:hypothetical protein